MIKELVIRNGDYCLSLGEFVRVDLSKLKIKAG